MYRVSFVWMIILIVQNCVLSPRILSTRRCEANSKDTG